MICAGMGRVRGSLLLEMGKGSAYIYPTHKPLRGEGAMADAKAQVRPLHYVRHWELSR